MSCATRAAISSRVSLLLITAPWRRAGRRFAPLV
ncbi:Uncharacterised protein [Bordetella pertussis]|nr:Uncharacterised protein [Bordetella pertussis]